MEAISGMGAPVDPMQHPVNQAMSKAVEQTMAFETDLMKASVESNVSGAQTEGSAPSVSQAFNAWA